MTVYTLGILGFRNQQNNFFRSIVGVWAVANRAPKAVHLFLSRIGLATAYTTTLKRLKTLADDAASRLLALGPEIAKGNTSVMLCFDNVNKSMHSREQAIGASDNMRCGTAATAIILEELPVGWMDPPLLAANRAKGKRAELEVEDLCKDVDGKHVDNVVMGSVMREAVRHIPELRRLSKEVEDRFMGCWSKLRMKPGRKTKMYPMQTSAINESTSKGVSAVLRDLTSQVGILPTWVDRVHVLVVGDQLSVHRTRQLLNYAAKETSAFDRFGWVLPRAELWHMKWAFLKGIYRTHWEPQTGKGIHGLRHDCIRLGRQNRINPKTCDFYPSHQLVRDRYSSLTMHALL